MRVLFIGGSSKLGSRVLGALLRSKDVAQVCCGVHRGGVPIQSPKIRLLPLDLAQAPDLAAAGRFDLLVLFAGVTHAAAERDYWDVNLRGTLRLAEEARRRGCRRLAYVSTRCVGKGSGAYGESKRAAEEALRRLGWESLLIIRPSEVYGAGGREGVDRFIDWGRRYHCVPMLFGDPRISFSPILARDFVRACAGLLLARRRGVKVIELCGPEELDGISLALRIARRYRALPIPLWWPALKGLLRLGRRLGVSLVAEDQLERLTGAKSASRSTDDPALAFPMMPFLAARQRGRAIRE